LLIGSGRFRFVSAGEGDDPSAKGPRRIPKVSVGRAREAGYELGADVAIFAVFRALKGVSAGSGAPGYTLELNCVATHDDLIWSATRPISRSDVDFFERR